MVSRRIKALNGIAVGVQDLTMPVRLQTAEAFSAKAMPST
jgi:hypothetical protein